MSLTTIILAKELAQSYKPVLLAEITFSSGAVLYLSDQDFRLATTGIQYLSNDYLPQIISQNLDAVQAMSAEGIDAVPTVTLKLADADRFLWTNYELTEGFKGASVVLRFVFFDLDAKIFSTDSIVKFQGISDPPNLDEDSLTIRCVSKMNMERQNLPIQRVQRVDPHPFPNTLRDRVAALVDDSSPFYPSGYSADVTDINVGTYYPGDPLAGLTGAIVGFGNLNGSVAYTADEYNGTYQNYLTVFGDGSNSLKDTSGRSTGTFGGVQWVPPNTFQGKQYSTGKTVYGVNPTNQTLYSQFVPMIYGTAQVSPLIVSSLSDPNSERGEAILCLYEINGIVNNEIIVNNTLVVAATDIDGNGIKVNDPLMRYDVINRGERNSPRVDGDAIFNSQGDCYGGMATIEYCVYNQIAAAGSFPNITAVVQGPSIRVYTDPTTYTRVYSANPAWVLMDLLIKSSAWTYDDLDIQTFIDAAAICDRSISYTLVDGSSGNHPLFEISLVITERKSAGNYIKAVRTSCRATLVPNSSNDGLLQLYIDGTLADQQPSPISGSNYNTAVPSIDHTGADANGYVAYLFTDSNGTILRNGRKSSLKITQTAIGSTPNSLSFNFQDSENFYNSDSVSECDSVDISRVAQQVNTGFDVAGIATFDQAQRIGAWWLGKTLRGNPRADTGGTMHFAWTTNFKGLHLRIGQIVMLTSDHDGLTEILVRLTSVKPSMNFNTVDLEGDFHIDEFYEDGYGQAGFVGSGVNRVDQRVPYPWFPNQVTPGPDDPLFDQTDLQFDISQSFTFDAANNPLANLVITGIQTINTFSNLTQAPLVRPSFNQAGTGGTIDGGFIYSLALCATDSANKFTPASRVVNCLVSTGTGTNTIELDDISWYSGTTGWALYGGLSPNAMCLQATGVDAPTTISLDSFKTATSGTPDPMQSSLHAYVKKIRHSGVLGTNISGVTSTTINCVGGVVDEFPWTVNQWAGRVVSVLGNKFGVDELPIWNYLITSNTSDILTVVGNPMLDGVSSQNVIVIRTLADTHTSTTIGDSSFINSLEPTGMDADAEKGNYVRIAWGTGSNQLPKQITGNTSTVLTIDGAFSPVPDATSIFIVEEPNWIADFPSLPLTCTNNTTEINLTVPITNYLNETLLVQVFTVDAQGNQSLAINAPWREVYVFGQHNAPTGPPQASFIFGRNSQGQKADVVLNGDTNTVIAKISGIMQTPTWDAVADTPPHGSDILIEFRKNGTVIGVVDIEQDVLGLQSGTFSGPISVSAGDLFTCKVTQIGSATAGQSVTVQLYWTPQAPPAS